MALTLFAKLGLDKTGFDAGMGVATKQVGKFGSDMKAALAGAFGVAAISMWLKGTADVVTRIKDLSEQFGITTDEVQKADFALKQSGMTFEALAGPMNKLASSRRDAVEGNQELRESFAKFGISVRDLNNPALRNFDILMKIAGAMKDGTVAANEQGFIMDLLGTKSGRLANVLQSLSVIKPPAIFEQKQIQAIDDATKAMERFKLAAQVETGGALGRWLDFWDIVTGKQAKEEFFAAQPATPKEIKDAQAVKKARMAARDVPLFELDKNVAEKDKPKGLFDIINEALQFVGQKMPIGARGTGAGGTGIDSDQFQRIGAFTGASGAQAQTEALRGLKATMDRILNVLDAKGARIRGIE